MTENSNSSLFQNIPKIFYCYWDGNTLPFLNYLTVPTFHRYNPDWEIRLYVPKFRYISEPTWNTGEQVGAIKARCYFQQLKDLEYVQVVEVDLQEIGFYNDVHEVHKSDYLRYYMMHQHGGVWSDLDILYTKPITEISNCRRFRNEQGTDTILIKDENEGYFPVGLLIASAGNDFYKFFSERTRDNYQNGQYQSIGIRMAKNTFMSYLKARNKDKLRTSKFTVCSINSYLPLNWKKIKDLFDNRNEKLHDTSIGIHWSYGSEYARRYIEFRDKNMTQVDTVYNGSIVDTIVQANLEHLGEMKIN